MSSLYLDWWYLYSISISYSLLIACRFGLIDSNIMGGFYIHGVVANVLILHFLVYNTFATLTPILDFASDQFRPLRAATRRNDDIRRDAAIGISYTAQLDFIDG